MSASSQPPSNSNRIVAVFFNNRYLLILTMVVTLVAGLSALNGLPRQEDPVITNRNPILITPFPGASADRVEALVTEKIEDELNEVESIKNITSTSRAGISIVSIELQDAVTKETVETIHSEIRDKLSDAAANFPPEVPTPIYDDKRNPVAFSLITAIRWTDPKFGSDSLGILSRRAEALADELRNINGTQVVRLYGQPSEEIRIAVDPAKLAQLNLTIPAVAAAIRSADVKVPAGQLRGQQADLIVEVDGQIDSLGRVREIIVRQAGEASSRSVRVGDIAEVARVWQEPQDQIALVDGQRSVLVAARMAEGNRIDVWDARASAILENFAETSGSAITLDPIFRQSDYTTERLGSLAQNLALGSLVVLIVIFLTMGWRRSLIVSSALPLTAAATLFVVSLQGGALHQMSIFGMIIALGLLIDTAIVITDEVRKFLDEGLSRREAVLAALKHLFVPLLSSTLTSILAFMPILLLPGSAGDFVGSIGGSVIVAISLSFLLSITVIAALAGLVSEKAAKRANKRIAPRWMREGLSIAWFTKLMRGIIRVSVRFPIVGLALGAAIPFAGFALAQTLGSQFFPRVDRDMFTVEISLPSVTSIEQTTRVAGKAEEVIRSFDGIERVHWLAGASFPPVYYNLIENRDNSAEYVMGVIDADNFETVDRLVPLLQDRLDLDFPEALVRVTKFAQGPPANADVEIRLIGPSLSELQRLGDAVQKRLAEHPDIIQAESTLTRGEPKLSFEADESAARVAGFELGDIATQLQASLEGLSGGSLIEAVEELPVRIRVPSQDRASIAEIADLRLVGSNGQKVPLRALGEFRLRPETGAITRRNGERVNSIRGYAAQGSLPIDITNQVISALESSDFELPTGYRLELGGEAENQGDAVGNLLVYLPVIITLTIAILILSFRSVRVMVVLCGAAFLSVGYGLFATWVMQFPLSFNTILGCIGLIGLAFNDNIVSLAAIFSNPKAKQGDVDAIVDEVAGCGRHLISTTLTTIGSFLPLLILIGGQFWPPLAIVLAGGVGGATFLAAVFTPAGYRLLVARKYRKREAKEPNPDALPAMAT
ncbi:MAG: efflux RND transporter permease subunit [Verrucomicrobiota bacterium]